MKKYWNELISTYNLTVPSGFLKFEKALETWFRRNHEVSLSDFVVDLRDGDPIEATIEIEVPSVKMDIPENLSSDDFLDLVEGSDSDKYDEAGLHFVEELIDADRLLSSWSMSLRPTDSSIVVITYTLS
jgi:hypothetical protein